MDGEAGPSLVLGTLHLNSKHRLYLPAGESSPSPAQPLAVKGKSSHQSALHCPSTGKDGRQSHAGPAHVARLQERWLFACTRWLVPSQG